jgi:hypothetical protein
VSLRHLALAGVLALGAAQPVLAAPVADAHIAMLGARLFPLLTAAESGPGNGLKAAPFLAQRVARIDACQHAPACVMEAAQWNEAERNALAGEIEGILARHPAPAGVVPDDGVRSGVERELLGLNSILKVYGLGEKPRYPAIDGPKDAIGSPDFTATVASVVMLGEAVSHDPATALDPSMALALALLDANNRDEAIAFDPLDSRYNKAAAQRVAKVDWARYRYTAILVLGVGPEDTGTNLSPLSKLNVRMAAQRYADGLAPFVLLSGANVHPRGTRHVEAVEMARALMERFGVPADSIIMDPYARHTTTNLRNATRRLVSLHMPLDRDMLVISNVDHIRAINSPAFVERNMHELGYQPGKVTGQPGPNDLAFRPNPQSLRNDPLDPLDP